MVRFGDCPFFVSIPSVVCHDSQLLELLDDSQTHCALNVFPDHRDSSCREKFYKLLHAVWARITAADAADDFSADVVTRVRHSLIASLSDNSAIVRRQAYDFWDSADRCAAVNGLLARRLC